MTQNTPQNHTDNIFFSSNLIDEKQTTSIVTDALNGFDDGELFLEYKIAESIIYDNNRLVAAQFDIENGFGLRGNIETLTTFAHSTEINHDALKRAAQHINTAKNGYSGAQNINTNNTENTQIIKPNQNIQQISPLYTSENPIETITLKQKLKLLEDINQYIRTKDTRVKQATIALAGSWQSILIIKQNGQIIQDIRPLVRLDITVVAENNNRQESGHSGRGGRTIYKNWINPKNWKQQANNAINQAIINLNAIPAPANETTVVLGPGWPGILLHEAVGHGLEGDFNYKKTSAFTDKIGTKVAADNVTVIDDGTIPQRRGSLTIDDEGTQSQKTVLIENGILKGYIQDKLNAKLMKQKATGNGRRENFACQPMPRMTNTFMINGKYNPDEIIKSVKNGVYAVSFGGGQVDITSGKFVFSCTEAYQIKNGKIQEPIKGATLIGTGPESMKQISMVGNDMKLDEGIGTCGKNGQGVPVGVGQPTLKIDKITVGGTKNS